MELLPFVGGGVIGFVVADFVRVRGDAFSDMGVCGVALDPCGSTGVAAFGGYDVVEDLPQVAVRLKFPTFFGDVI